MRLLYSEVLVRVQLVAKSLVIDSLGAFRFLVRRMTVPFLIKTG